MSDEKYKKAFVGSNNDNDMNVVLDLKANSLSTDAVVFIEIEGHKAELKKVLTLSEAKALDAKLQSFIELGEKFKAEY